MNIFLEAEMCDYFCNVKVKKKPKQNSANYDRDRGVIS